MQPTATARRRPALGRGCRRVAKGRPANVPRTAEHAFAIVKKKRMAAPHCLAHVVSENVALGKKH